MLATMQSEKPQVPISHMTFKSEVWRLRQPFHFAGYTVEALDTVYVEVSDGTTVGHGEGVIPVVFNYTMAEAEAQLNGARHRIAAGEDAATVCASLAPNAARNALDCAIWDFACKAGGMSAWDVAGLSHRPLSLAVDQSIGLASPDEMAETALASAHSVLKIKLDRALVEERISAIRGARRDAVIIVDANQAWSIDELKRHAPVLAQHGVSMIEQPLRVGSDHELAGLDLPVPIYADESCHTRQDLQRLSPFYDGINIKLDKSGGLTEGLALARAATELGLGLMVGCMAGTSLSMAPAYVVASLCNWADLDGPLLLAEDRDPPMRYEHGQLHCFQPQLWG